MEGAITKPSRSAWTFSIDHREPAHHPDGATKRPTGNGFFFSNLVDQLTQKINNKRQNLNTKIKAFNQAVLKAAQESIPRGARRNYKPYWTEEQQENAVIEARNLVEETPQRKTTFPEGSICKTP